MRELTAIGSYIFAGGFTVGVRKHFDVLAHFEEGLYGTETAALNLPELRGKIFTDPATWPVGDYAGKVDFVYGNPPCAPWSVCSAGRKVPWRLDPRLGCAQKLYGLLDQLQPKVWAWESVRPAYTKGRELVDEFVAKAKGYHATALLVEGTRHNVPQRRPRFFLVLSKVDLPWEPTRVRGIPTVNAAFEKPFARETKSIENLDNKFFMKLVRDAKPGQRLAALFNERFPERVAEGERTGEWVKQRPSFQNIRLDGTKPSCTLTGGAKQVHPTLDRLITIEESAALCGYPRSFKFLGTIGKQYQQVAQAVMPPVGEYLAKVVAAGLRANRKLNGGGSFEEVEIFNDSIERRQLEVGESTALISLPPPVATEPKEKPMTNKFPASTEKILNLTALEIDGERFAWHPKRKAFIAYVSGTAKPTTITITQRIDARGASKAEVAKLSKALTTPDLRESVRRGNGKLPAMASQNQKPVPSGSKKPGSGARIRELLVKGTNAEAILAIIHREFPQSKAQKSDVAWNLRKLRSEGVKV